MIKPSQTKPSQKKKKLKGMVEFRKQSGTIVMVNCDSELNVAKAKSLGWEPA